MKTTDLIRSILDLIDAVDEKTNSDISEPSDTEVQHDDQRRFKHIFDILSQASRTDYSNEPDEAYTSISAVTTDAGGGVNMPSHPKDIRIKDPGVH